MPASTLAEAPRVAGAMMSVHRALIDYARRRALARRGTATLAADIEREGKRAVSLLAGGLGEYALKRR